MKSQTWAVLWRDEHSDDPAKKEFLLDFLLTMKPLAEWSASELDVLTQACATWSAWPE